MHLARLRGSAIALLIAACAGCAPTATGTTADGTSATASSSPSVPRAVELTVRVGLFGGPIKLDGTMADDNTPAEGITVTVTGSGPVTVSRTTGPDGTAVIAVAPGRWTVSSTCGNPQTLDVERSTVVAVQCDVP